MFSLKEALVSQSQTNQTEWQDEQNWVSWFGIYSSRADSRLWVPKRMPAMGWTIYFGHPKGAVTFWIILSLIASVLLAVLYVF